MTDKQRPFFLQARIHGIMLEPWRGPCAWWRSPTGELWASLLIAAPVALLVFLVEWACWKLFAEKRS